MRINETPKDADFRENFADSDSELLALEGDRSSAEDGEERGRGEQVQDRQHDPPHCPKPLKTTSTSRQEDSRKLTGNKTTLEVCPTSV